jgi:hypothetical protein
MVLSEISRRNPNASSALDRTASAGADDSRVKASVELVDRLSRLVLESKFKTV